MNEEERYKIILSEIEKIREEYLNIKADNHLGKNTERNFSLLRIRIEMLNVLIEAHPNETAGVIKLCHSLYLLQEEMVKEYLLKDSF